MQSISNFMRAVLALQWISIFPMPCYALATSLESVCQSLEASTTLDVVLPSDSNYANLSEENWSQTTWKSPACILRPVSAEQIAAVLPQLVAGNISFAVRSGGHLPSPGAANIDEGVLIDLSKFDHVTFDAEKGAASIGAGQRWLNVYTQLDKYNVTVVGGRVTDVGVGGLTLGSGLSYLSDLYGLVCDNVLAFQLVLGNGSTVEANATQNPDLFWALKGGINNFGIVTNMVLRTYPIRQVWAGVKGYAVEQIPALFDALLEYQLTPNKDPYANLMIQGFATNASLGVAVSMIYLKPEASPPAFSPFYRLNTTYDTTAITTLTEFLIRQGGPDLPRIDQRATSFKPDAALYKKIANIAAHSPHLDAIRSAAAGSQAFGLQPISASLVAAGRARGGGNALGLEAANQTWMVLTSGWWSAADDAVVHGATRAMADDIEGAARRARRYVEYIFMNDAGADQAVIAHYGARNVARLRRVQEAYDLGLVFQRLVPGGFKLP
ncbi:FAD-binding oxidoreductase [Apiospora aurea]|uniref:FAD-binding oxidoreductase n=1 Tax=Apiospora aurea TaxID=335848 RepID=A0ABR1QL44_9PEZI